MHKKYYYSKILDKDIKVFVTLKALEEIDNIGGFDNYILLTPADKMVSLFGEYLRELMFRKINNPNLDLKNANIFGTTPDVFRKTPTKF